MEKCLHILPMNKLSGAEKMALLICKNLKNYEPVVICGGEVLQKVFKESSIPAYRADFSRKHMMKGVKEIKDIIKLQDIKIVHAHDNVASLYAYLVKKLYKKDIKIVSHIHNCYPWLEDGGINKKIDNYMRPKYDYNVTCGSVVYDYYKSNSGSFKYMKVFSLSNAIDVKEIDGFDLKTCEELRNKFNIPKDKIVLGYIGRLDDQKGILPFIKAMAEKKLAFEGCRILMVGNGSQEKEVKVLIDKLGLSELFIFTGYQPDTYRFYPLMDLFFLPSKYEGLPMVLLEAMAFKLPIISMEVGSIGELLKDERGLLIRKGCYVDFVSGLIKLKNDGMLRQKISNDGYKYVNENYSIEKYIEKLERKYYELSK